LEQPAVAVGSLNEADKPQSARGGLSVSAMEADPSEPAECRSRKNSLAED
jgi:hypothetical protein